MDESGKAIARPAATQIAARGGPQGAAGGGRAARTTSPIARDGEIARLELLKAELEAVFAELPAQ